ncbi:MAG TPA: hypothetical protein VJV78_26530 [Polyangiales bacterium]|nr:hypothetical protein [Polyangiales bacterium]
MRRIGFLGLLTGLLGCSSEDPMSMQPAASAGTSGNTPSGAPPAAGGGSGAGNGGTPVTTPSTGIAGTSAGAAGKTTTPAAGSGGVASVGGAPAAGSSGSGTAGMTAPAAGSGGMTATPSGEPFSFFVASWKAMQRVSGSPDGFGGDLRHGTPDGLSGADKICTEIAETSMPGSGAKMWKAFLSVTKGPDGQPVHAIDRVGAGPWYDRVGRLVAMNKTDLLQSRPRGADPMIINDLPNEDGIPNQAPDGMKVDNHDILTGTNNMGRLFNTDWAYTCHDWTSAVGRDGTPRVGHSWPRMGGGGPRGGGRTGSAGMGGFVPPPGALAGASGGEFDLANWMSSLNEAGCAPGASLVEMGPPNPDIPTVGSGGGYGGIYCFALKP